MSNYTHILVGLDLSEESSEVMDKAMSIAEAMSAKLSLVHIIEPLTFAYGGDIPVDLSDIQEQLKQQASDKLDSIASGVAIEIENKSIIMGQPVQEIHSMAERINADLIIVGSHGRKGLALLLGSTANGVIHGAKTDVLAVRVAGK